MYSYTYVDIHIYIFNHHGIFRIYLCEIILQSHFKKFKILYKTNLLSKNKIRKFVSKYQIRLYK